MQKYKQVYIQINSLYVTYTYYPAVIYANADATRSNAKNKKEKKIDKPGSPLDLESRSNRQLFGKRDDR